MLATLISAGRYFHSAVRGDTTRLSKADLSQVISFARISLIVGLVFIHYGSYPNVEASPFRGLDITSHQAATYVQSFVLFFFFAVVPLLSMISGWLFFSFNDADAKEALLSRVRRRFGSLYLPLIFWNLFFLVILLTVFWSDPTNPIFEEINYSFQTAGLWDYLNALFGITRHPIGFQFWFVRDLFVTVLVSPILWLMLTRAPLVGITFIGAAWLSGHDLWIFFRTDVVFFFYLGGLLRLRRVPLEISAKATLWLMSLYLVLVALRALTPYVIDGSPFVLDVATRAMRIPGVLACWGVFQRIALSPRGATIAKYGGLAFFLHSVHFPLIGEVKILLWYLLPAETDGWMILHYLLSVAVTVIVGLALGVVMARLIPKSFSLLNGGRAVGFGSPTADRPRQDDDWGRQERYVAAPSQSRHNDDVN
jgi:surface polysaccharide O-acyltransferase-like enzyme